MSAHLIPTVRWRLLRRPAVSRFARIGLAALLAGTMSQTALSAGAQGAEPSPPGPSRSDVPSPARLTPSDRRDKVIEGVTHGSRWVVDVRTGDAAPLPLSLRPVFATGYTISPNGRRVAFTAPDPDGALGSSRLFLATTDGTRVRPITPGGTSAWEPAWSPDGHRIVYRDEAGLAVVHLASGRVRRFGRVSPHRIARPGFRPDGQTILFTRTGGTPGEDALWSVPAFGGRPRPVVRHASLGTWSPDGSRIALQRFSSHGGHRSHDHHPGCFDLGASWSRLGLADADGGKVRLIPGTRVSGSDPGDDPADRRPVWAPDGRHVALALQGRIVIVEVPSGSVRQLVCGRRPTWWDRDHVLVESFDGDCDGAVDAPA
jgi:Tol biopolymer transport system component